jgi:hypothetical protein
MTSAASRGLIAAGVTLTLFGFVVVVAVFNSPADRKPSSRAAKNWSADELIAHLQQLGLPVRLDSISKANTLGVPTYNLVGSDGYRFDGRVLILTDLRISSAVDDVMSRASHSDPKTDWFGWGRFLFSGDPAMVGEVRRLLPS